MKDKKRILQLLIATAEVLRGELSEPAQEMYLSVLIPYDDDQIVKALNECVRECRFFPVPADIIERIDGTKDVSALTAWDTVLYSAQHKGAIQGGKFDNPDIEHAVRLCGGFAKICNTNEEDLQWIKKEFIEAFKNVGHSAYRPAIGAKEELKKLSDVIFKSIN